MKFTFLTYGTEGDTRPMVALAKALRDRGHEAHLLADRASAAQAQAHGVPFTALDGDIRELVSHGAALAGVMRDGGSLARITRACAELAVRNTAAWMQTAREAADGTDVLVFSGLASYAGLAVADGMRLPAIGAGLWPMTPTRDFGCAFMRPRRLPGWANLLSHHLLNGLSWRLFRPGVDEGSKRVFGLAPRTRMWRGYPILYGCSPALIPRPAEWASNVELCGTWQLPQPDWQPPAALQDFLADGEAPVYVGFGSMAGFDRRRLLAALTEGLAGRRVLFYPGWSGLDTSQLPANFHVLGDTPHGWLFRRTCLNIHHGGAGTTHAAAASGVPSLVLPFAGDQFFWADRLARAGAAVHWPAHAVDGAALKLKVEAASQPAMRAGALRLSERMRHEHGIGFAVERLLGGAPARLGERAA
jgi:UDP:flavonoid glycosyltransferase YjiC (YdhE family)